MAFSSKYREYNVLSLVKSISNFHDISLLDIVVTVVIDSVWYSLLFMLSFIALSVMACLLLLLFIAFLDVVVCCIGQCLLLLCCLLHLHPFVAFVFVALSPVVVHCVVSHFVAVAVYLHY